MRRCISLGHACFHLLNLRECCKSCRPARPRARGNDAGLGRGFVRVGPNSSRLRDGRRLALPRDAFSYIFMKQTIRCPDYERQSLAWVNDQFPCVGVSSELNPAFFFRIVPRRLVAVGVVRSSCRLAWYSGRDGEVWIRDAHAVPVWVAASASSR